MKRALISVLFLMSSLLASSQVFNTASVLKPGKFSLGIEPVVYDNDLGLFLHGGVGLKAGVDLSLKYGFLKYNDYFGADLEWSLLAGKPSISLTTGGHMMHDFGFDFGLNLSFSVSKGAQLYTGIDSDLNFYQNDTRFLAWIPVGVQLSLRSKVAFMLEAEIGITDNSYPRNIFGGGLAFYF